MFEKLVFIKIKIEQLNIAFIEIDGFICFKT
jgi:hypothetical protein